MLQPVANNGFSDTICNNVVKYFVRNAMAYLMYGQTDVQYTV